MSDNESPLKLYAGQKPDNSELYRYLSLLKAHWEPEPYDQRLYLYTTRITHVCLVENPEESEFFLLPRGWNDYVSSRTIDQAIAFARQAERFGKLMIIWQAGDYEARIPITNAIHIHSGLHRSRPRKPAYVLSRPAFNDDHTKNYPSGKPEYRQKQSKPIVGFCGHVSKGLTVRNAAQSAKAVLLHAAYQLGYGDYQPPQIYPPTLLRKQVLDTLAGSPHVETNFILRDKYLGGKQVLDGLTNTHQEFVDNLRNTDYTVCVRGNGNFSKRFYETLCCGRIPIFIDTDCVLPFEFAIDWRKYCVYVDQSEIRHTAEKVADFHNDIHPDDFVELQQNCRTLWDEWLSTRGFYKHLSALRMLVSHAST